MSTKEQNPPHGEVTHWYDNEVRMGQLREEALSNRDVDGQPRVGVLFCQFFEEKGGSFLSGFKSKFAAELAKDEHFNKKWLNQEAEELAEEAYILLLLKLSKHIEKNEVKVPEYSAIAFTWKSVFPSTFSTEKRRLDSQAKQLEKKSLSYGDYDEEVAPSIETVTSPKQQPEHLSEIAELYEWITYWLEGHHGGLDEKDAVILRMTSEGFVQREIAEKLGISQGEVSTKRIEARRKVARLAKLHNLSF